MPQKGHPYCILPRLPQFLLKNKIRTLSFFNIGICYIDDLA